MRISYVVPCYGSEKTIKKVVDEIICVHKLYQYGEYEIILVNDNSPDNVWNVIDEMSKEDKNIIGLSFSRNFGQHAALLAGYAESTGDFVVSLDDDGQTPIDELPLLMKKINEGYDVVYAAFNKTKQNVFRRFGTYINRKTGEAMIGQPKGLIGSSFFVVRKYVIDEICLYKNPYPYIAGLLFRVTKNATCVVTNHRHRIEGKSGYSMKKLLLLWLNGFTSFSIKPLEMSMLLGGMIACGGFVFAIITIIRKFLIPGIALGWSSIISTMLILGGIILIMLGLIGEYVGRIYICINDAPQYVIKEKTGPHFR